MIRKIMAHIPEFVSECFVKTVLPGIGLMNNFCHKTPP
jgi:hypothetical protein